MFDANMRGKAVAIFVVAPFAGPALGPIVRLFLSLREIASLYTKAELVSVVARSLPQVGGFMAVAGLKWYVLFFTFSSRNPNPIPRSKADHSFSPPQVLGLLGPLRLCWVLYPPDHRLPSRSSRSYLSLLLAMSPPPRLPLRASPFYAGYPLGNLLSCSPQTES
jgi:hypothetical protein